MACGVSGCACGDDHSCGRTLMQTYQRTCWLCYSMTCCTVAGIHLYRPSTRACGAEATFLLRRRTARFAFLYRALFRFTTVVAVLWRRHAAYNAARARASGVWPQQLRKRTTRRADGGRGGSVAPARPASVACCSVAFVCQTFILPHTYYLVRVTLGGPNCILARRKRPHWRTYIPPPPCVRCYGVRCCFAGGGGRCDREPWCAVASVASCRAPANN